MKFFYLFIIVFCLVGCEKNFDIPASVSEDLLVVDAQIENGEIPTVVLSKSLSYFSKIDPQILASSFVRNADVRMSNGTVTHKFREYEVGSFGAFKFYVYSIDTSNLSTAFLGEVGKNYRLTINVNGKNYEAQTSIRNFRRVVDSIFFKKRLSTTDSTYELYLRSKDPAGLGDYIRYWTKKNKQSYFPGFNSVFTDEFIDGTSFEVIVEPGFNRNPPPNDTTVRNFFKGDTVTLKIADIDKATYDFWNTWEFAAASVGNPFSSPTRIKSNISNGALGVFAGYASKYYTRIVK